MQNNNYVEYTYEIKEKLSKKFRCGNASLDNFLSEEISLDKRNGKTYVYLDENGERIIAYFNITTGSIAQKDGNVNINCGGAIHINCFALDIEYHHMDVTDHDVKVYLSDILLIKCMGIINEIRDKHVGFSFITLCSTKEGYKTYKRNGFLDLEDDMEIALNNSEKMCAPMYLPILDL